MSAPLRRHWRTLLGAVLGAAGGALYAHFIGCRTGTCALTASPWRAGIFFGLTGAIALWPSSPRRDTGSAGPV